MDNDVDGTCSLLSPQGLERQCMSDITCNKRVKLFDVSYTKA